MSEEPWWLDPTSAWQLKLARAGHHIDDLAREVEAFVRDDTYSVVPESGDQPGETIYRLRMTRTIPTRFSTIIGDALHNLRSALDCAAFELARRHVGGTLNEEEERACSFPIDGNPAAIHKFFKDKGRTRLYSERDQRAIAAVQPGWLHDYVERKAMPQERPRGEEVAYDSLTLLNRLSNVDKHRRVHLVTSSPDLVYWGSDEVGEQHWRWGRPPFQDGSILGRLLEDDPERAGTSPPTLYHEMDLRVVDPPEASYNDVVSLLRHIHGELLNRVIPNVLNPAVDPERNPFP